MQSTRDIIVIGASAGGLSALTELVGLLPPTLPAAIFIVTHMSPDADSYLGEILSRAGPLKAAIPEDKDPIQSGRIYVAAPDRHLLVEPGHVRLIRGPRENRHRP